MTSERTRMRATTLVVGVALALILIPMVFDEPATDYQTLTVAGSGPLSSERVMALQKEIQQPLGCLLYTSPSPRDGLLSRMPSSA